MTNISSANDSGVYGTVEEVFRKVSSYAPEDVIKRIFFEFEVGKKLYLNHTHVKLLKVNFPLNCLSLNMTKLPEIRERRIQSVRFFFHGGKNISSIQINAQGIHLVTHRDTFHNSLYSTGDALIGDPGYFNKYVIEISENVYVEEDPSKKCRKYPNDEYESFTDCDNQYLRNVCKKHNISPIWLTNDFAKVTTQHYFNAEEVSNIKLTSSEHLKNRESKLNRGWILF